MICVLLLQKVTFSGTDLCPSAPEGSPSHFREKGLQRLSHKHETSLVLLRTKLVSSTFLGFPIFLTPCSTSQVNFSCNSMNSALHHNILLPPYVPKIFSSLSPPQHWSIPCSHQCTLLSAACPTNTASVSSAGHLAWQTDWPGSHCL